MKKSGISASAGLMAVGVALSLQLAACTAAKPPSQGWETVAPGERDSLNGAPLPPIQFTYEEMGDFPPVGAPRLPVKIEIKQN